MGNSHHHDHHQLGHEKQKKRYVDPICGMSTDDAGAFIAYEHDGETDYFCSRHCLEKFKRQKEKGSVRHAETGNANSSGEAVFT